MRISKFNAIIHSYRELLSEADGSPPVMDAAEPVQGNRPVPQQDPGEESKLPDATEDTPIPAVKMVPILRKLRRALLISLDEPGDENILNDLGDINENDIERAEQVINNVIDKYTATDI